MLCTSCKGDDFYENNGVMCCEICGTQSQDWLAESFEADHMESIGRVGGKVRVTQNKRIKLKSKNQNPELKDYLKAYQFCLQLISSIVSNLSNCNDITNRVKEIWMIYLRSLNSNNEIILDSFTNHFWQRHREVGKSFHKNKNFTLNTSSVNSKSSNESNHNSSTKARNIVVVENLNHDNAKINDFDGNDGVGCYLTNSDDDSDDNSVDGNNSNMDSYKNDTINTQNLKKNKEEYTGHTKDKEKEEKYDTARPPQPSRPLLLGFIYLACRLCRTWVTPTDLIRWCINGNIPFTSLWESLPQQLQLKIKRENGSFFWGSSNIITKLLSPTNILFYTIKLADIAGITEIPPLNSPLIAYSYISALGLPSYLWTTYIEITQIFRGSALALEGLRATEQNYPIEIMAAIICACKMTNYCFKWNLEKIPNKGVVDIDNLSFKSKKPKIEKIDSSDDELLRTRKNGKDPELGTTHRVSSYQNSDKEIAIQPEHTTFVMPTTLSELDLLPRNQLKKFLHTLTKLWQHRTEANASNNIKDIFNFTVRQFLQINDIKINQLKSSELQQCATVLSTASQPCHSKQSSRERKYFNRIYNLPCRGRNISGYTNPRNYITYLRHGDETAIPHPPYVALLERCARHIMTSPGLLHRYVERIDRQIIDLAEGRTPVVETLRGGHSRDEHVLADYYNTENAINRSENDKVQIKELISYRKYANKIFPVLKMLGLQGGPGTLVEREETQDISKYLKEGKRKAAVLVHEIPPLHKPLVKNTSRLGSKKLRFDLSRVEHDSILSKMTDGYGYTEEEYMNTIDEKESESEIISGYSPTHTTGSLYISSDASDEENDNESDVIFSDDEVMSAITNYLNDSNNHSEDNGNDNDSDNYINDNNENDNNKW